VGRRGLPTVGVPRRWAGPLNTVAPDHGCQTSDDGWPTAEGRFTSWRVEDPLDPPIALG